MAVQPTVRDPGRRQFTACSNAPFRSYRSVYLDDQLLIGELSRSVAGALISGGAAIIVATESPRQHLLHGLADQEIDVPANLPIVDENLDRS
jgi:hypothetical protein